jgi:hypothetical protein
MLCPKCGKPMVLHETEDEKTDGTLYHEARYECACGEVVHDWDDRYEFPEEPVS